MCRHIALKRIVLSPHGGIHNEGYISQHDQFVRTWKFIAGLLGVTHDISRKIVYQHRDLSQRKQEDLKNVVCVLRNLNIPISHIAEHPTVLLKRPDVIQWRFYCLEECGIHPIGLPEVLRYKLLMKKTPLEIMKLKLLTTNVDIAQHIVNCASPGSRLASRKLPNMNNLPLFLIRQFLLVSLLRELLMLPRHELQRLILKKPEICNRPISHIQKTASFLFAVIKLTAKQILSNGSLLLTDANNGCKVLHRLSLDETNAIDLIQRYPGILCLTYEDVCQRNVMLKQLGFDNSEALNNGQVYLLDQSIIAEYFRSVSGHDFSNHLTSSEINHTLYWQRKLEFLVKSRAGVHNQACPERKYHHHTHKCRQYCSLFQKTVGIIANQLNCSELELKQKLQRCHDIKHHHFVNSKDTIEYFLNKGFNSLHILNALHIMLLPKSVIQPKFEEFEVNEASSLLNDQKSQPYILQIFLYNLWKSYPYIFVVSDVKKKLPVKR